MSGCVDVNLSQWNEELGPKIKSIQDHMRADLKNGSCLKKKKKNWSQQETFGGSEVFRAVAVNMSEIDWRKNNVYQRQLETCCAQDDGQVCLRGGAGHGNEGQREKESDFIIG